ncbi:hypothetical protein [Roseobacter sp. CCS2]|uniref:hypothetical protein n=1 Tax=Roseobacter sp. CCS2 TaxID=391593 RepID=UPI0012EA31C8|nr:hypothetical protein [Roseobacter sp. CCS2]
MGSFIFGLMVLATASAAQDDNQITLKYGDGSGVSGELVGFEDSVFRIQASIGLIAVPAQDVSCIGRACPEGTALEVPAAPATLTSLDGSFRMFGNVIDFVDGEYVLATDIGELRISASDTTCEGDGCVAAQPTVDQRVALVSGTTTIEGNLLRVEDGAYIIDVDRLGEMRVDANIFDCRGDACP